MDLDELMRRYRELQDYVGWRPEDAVRVAAVAPILAPHFGELVDDFYREIERHPEARKVITGGEAQIRRLKGTLTGWLRELMAGQYDAAYLQRRWQVGWRHVEIGLPQVFTNVALARLRQGLTRLLPILWTGDIQELHKTTLALNMLLDLDLAIIEDAYQSEYLARQQRTERLAAVGQVSAGVAHELRNPLNVVKTSVYYLLNARTPSLQKTREHLERIERHVDLADGVITALSRFTRMPLPDLKPTPLEPCLRQALEISPANPVVGIVFEEIQTLPLVLMDSDQVSIVFSNLIRNAFDAMPHGGTLTLRGSTENTAVAVEVRDTGIGISPENLARVTEPLFSTKARGLGLGLSIARAILEKNGGHLAVHSVLGQGSNFTVRLTPATMPSPISKSAEVL